MEEIIVEKKAGNWVDLGGGGRHNAEDYVCFGIHFTWPRNW
jgi:hypothetical protein